MDEVMIHAASEAYLEQQNDISSEHKKQSLWLQIGRHENALNLEVQK